MNTNTAAIKWMPGGVPPSDGGVLALSGEARVLDTPVPARALPPEGGTPYAEAARRNARVWLLIAFASFLILTLPARAGTVLGPWVPIFKGIDHAIGTNTPGGGGFPDLMVINALRVDLTDTNLQFYASPRIPGGYSVDNHETGGYTTTNFLKNHGLQVAMNANFFHDPGTGNTESPSYTLPQGTPFDLIGLEICQGQVVSPQSSSDYTASFLFTTNNQVTFIPTNWPAHSTAGTYTAVTGTYTILVNGVNVGSNYINNGEVIHLLNPRSAIGLSADRHYMYLMVIDGRQSGYSDGAYDWETAKWLILLGATDGANMDGGGSSCLAMQGSTGIPISLNRDSAAAAYGVERTDGSHLGIFAKPVPGFINNVIALADDTAATITWTTLTNATTQVKYGLTTNFTYSTALLPALVTNHAALLTNLTANTGYYFAVYSQSGSSLYVSSNYFLVTTNYVTTDAILDITNSWAYSVDDLDGVSWTAANYNDSAWTGSGPGLLWADVRGANPDISFLDTEMPSDQTTGYPFVTYYFRTHFTYTNSLSNVSFQFTTFIDDGAVFYLNGSELYRMRMPAAPATILNSTLATGYACSGDATCPVPFTVSGLTNLLVGDNVLAVEVHNYNAASPDITFGTSLEATAPLANLPRIGIVQTNQSISLAWSRGGFTLQQAGSPTGPWTDVPGPVVSSPYVITNATAHQFFRLAR